MIDTFKTADEWMEAVRKEGREEKAKHPFRYFMRRTWPRFWRCYIHEPWYWLKCHVWHRYNVLVMRDLPPTWVDRDVAILHANFQILKDFVEKEDRGSEEFPGHTQRSREDLISDYWICKEREYWTEEQIAESRKFAEQRADDWMEIKALYDWWEVRRRVGDDGDWAPGAEMNQDQEDTEKLKRLIELRGYLWS